MKPIIILCAAALITTAAFAQNTTSTLTLAGPTIDRTSVMKKSGKVWIVKPMQDNETMANGLLIESNGTVKYPTGKTFILNNGDCISTNGKSIGLNEKGIDSALIKNGKMWVITVLNEPLLLSDGTSILPNGTFINIYGKTVKLTEDEIINISSSKAATWHPKNVMALNSN